MIDPPHPTALYITYDGLTDPLGQSQVLPYLVKLASRGYGFHVLSFEKPPRLRQRGDETRALLKQRGIEWTPLPYTKRPPVVSTLYDVARMARAARRITARQRIALIHCRSYVPSIVGVRLATRLGIPVVFDMRGFWPDEKVDAGAWPLSNPVYKTIHSFFKREEERFLAAAEAIIVLTEAARESLRTRGVNSDRVTVIPCSVDFSEFTIPSGESRAAARSRLGYDQSDYVAAYVGSLGTWYMLDELLSFFGALRDAVGPRARLLIVTLDSPRIVLDAAARQNLPRASIQVTSARRAEVPGLLAAADAGLSLVRPSPSKVASSPTKIGEYLAMGLPVVTSAGIGDTDHVIADTRGGYVLRCFTGEHLARAVAVLLSLDPGDRPGRRERARGWFDLDEAVDNYARVYSRLLDR